MHAATDVTGFGLLGHLRELCVGSGVGADARRRRGPGDRRRPRAARRGHGRGRHATQPRVRRPTDVDFGELPEAEQLLLADAQTSGGLLLAVIPTRSTTWSRSSTRATLAAAVIGHARRR